jgi:hypothetical protein
MSCFIVSNETLGRVVQAAATKDNHNYEYFGKAFEKLRYDLTGEVRAADLERLARDLFDLNVDAFCERYPANSDDSNSRTRYPEDIPEFEYVQLTGKLNRAALIQAHKSASCLSYQCSEGDIPERPLYKALKEFIRNLERHLVTSDPAWETALWG